MTTERIDRGKMTKAEFLIKQKRLRWEEKQSVSQEGMKNER